MALNWKHFTGAAVVVGAALLPFAPLPSILLGIVVACGAHWFLERPRSSGSGKKIG